MKKAITILTILLPLFSMAQGIRFEEGLTWEQIKQKAKAENKYIFVDVYATWCVPCKKMDKEVYTDQKVGNVFNEKFISVKLQMDKTDKDDTRIKSWYKKAEETSVNFNITVFPSYLFFSPDAKPVHKSTGFMSCDSFINNAKDALNPDKQYYSTVERFQPGKLDTAEMKGLARAYKRLGVELSEKIILDYFRRVPDSAKFTAENLKFLGEFNRFPQIQNLAFEYLQSLRRKEFAQKQNINFAIAFCSYRNVKVQNVCIAYLKSLDSSNLSELPNLEFLSALNTLEEAQDIATNYLKNLDLNKWKQEQNLKLAEAFNNNKIMQEMAGQFINKLTKKDLNKDYVIEFIRAFTKQSKFPGFNLFYRNTSLINSVMGGKDYAQSLIRTIIKIEEVQPYWTARQNSGEDEIDWAKINKIISYKYNNDYARRCVLESKVAVYSYDASQNNRNWSEYIRYNIELIEKYGTDTTSDFSDATVLNNFSWEIFIHSDDKEQISKGIKWMKAVVARRPDNMSNIDTYANLLYKAQRKDEAIQWEEKALKMALEKNDLEMVKSYKVVIGKMQKGESTWKINE